MGQDKAFLNWNGRPLLTCQLQTLQRLQPVEIFISGRVGADYQPFGHTVLHDAFPDCGPLAGIEQALKTAQGSHLLVLAVDLPLMSSGFLKKLIDRCTDTQGTVPMFDRSIQPMAAVYPKTAHSVAIAMLNSGHSRVTQFAASLLNLSLARSFDVSEQDTSHFTNWNTPADKP